MKQLFSLSCCYFYFERMIKNFISHLEEDKRKQRQKILALLGLISEICCKESGWRKQRSCHIIQLRTYFIYQYLK